MRIDVTLLFKVVVHVQYYKTIACSSLVVVNIHQSLGLRNRHYALFKHLIVNLNVFYSHVH
jgi:hypothetical protein